MLPLATFARRGIHLSTRLKPAWHKWHAPIWAGIAFDAKCKSSEHSYIMGRIPHLSFSLFTFGNGVRHSAWGLHITITPSWEERHNRNLIIACAHVATPCSKYSKCSNSSKPSDGRPCTSMSWPKRISFTSDLIGSAGTLAKIPGDDISLNLQAVSALSLRSEQAFWQ